MRLNSGEVKNVRTDNLEKVMPSPKRSKLGTPPSSPRAGKCATPPSSPGICKSPGKKRKENPWDLPKLDFDAKASTDLDEDDIYKRDVFLAVKAHTEKHAGSWTASMMREDIANENNWENTDRLVNVVKASILKLGFSSLGATGGGRIQVSSPNYSKKDS